MQLSYAGKPSSHDLRLLKESCCYRKTANVCISTNLVGTRLQSCAWCCERERTRTEQWVVMQEKDDCTHWCHPSGYQIWISQLYQVLQEQVHALPPVQATAEATSL